MTERRWTEKDQRKAEARFQEENDPDPDGAPCCPEHSSNLGAACDFPGYAANH